MLDQENLGAEAQAFKTVSQDYVNLLLSARKMRRIPLPFQFIANLPGLLRALSEGMVKFRADFPDDMVVIDIFPSPTRLDLLVVSSAFTPVLEGAAPPPILMEIYDPDAPVEEPAPKPSGLILLH